MNIRGYILSVFNIVYIYHSNATAESHRECKQDIYHGIQPLCPPFVSTFIKLLDLASEHSDDGTGWLENGRQLLKRLD
jgi:hypothetical protein